MSQYEHLRHFHALLHNQALACHGLANKTLRKDRAFASFTDVRSFVDMIKLSLRNILKPSSLTEDSKRKEFILNVLLLSSVAIFTIATIVSLSLSLINRGGDQRNFLSITPLVILALFFYALYALSRKGFSKLSAHILIATFLLLAFYMGYRWGIDVTASMLLYILSIVMAGILISTRYAFITTGVITIVLLVLGQLQRANIILADSGWRHDIWKLSDTIMTCIIFFTVAIVSWLSNREIERSLSRARRSEALLRKQRDSLELIVEERTKELKEAQLEKITQLYSFAEFGRLSSGLFHDLMNPLTAISLNVERAQSEGSGGNGLTRTQQYLDHAFAAAKRMERFIVAVRKQIRKQGEEKLFSLTEETQQVIDILSYKAHLSHVSLILEETPNLELVGDPSLWSQVMLNLVTNGIDAYDGMDRKNQEVIISFSQTETNILCTVHDHGVGIPTENLKKIFDPFFTTKPGSSTKGTGVGLSIVKRIIEKSFNGSIGTESTPGKGTTFSILLSK